MGKPKSKRRVEKSTEMIGSPKLIFYVLRRDRVGRVAADLFKRNDKESVVPVRSWELVPLLSQNTSPDVVPTAIVGDDTATGAPERISHSELVGILGRTAFRFLDGVRIFPPEKKRRAEPHEAQSDLRQYHRALLAVLDWPLRSEEREAA